MKITETMLMTPGPLHLDSEVALACAKPLVHHLSPEFSEVYCDCVNLLKKLINTKNLYILTSSGTGMMEAAVANMFNDGDTVLSVETGVFGARFTEICNAYRLNTKVIKCSGGHKATISQLEEAFEKYPDIKGVTITYNETSTGVVNDIKAVGDYLKSKNVILIVDAVSGLGVMPYDHDGWNVDVTVCASQKGFLAPPALGILALSEKAEKRMAEVECRTLYFNLKRYKAYQQRKYPCIPFTPAVSVMYALRESLRKIDSIGLSKFIARYAKYAGGLRAALKALGIKLFTSEDALSNMLTVFYVPDGINADEVQKAMDSEYSTRIAGGQVELTGKVLRITTVGSICERDLIGTVGVLEMVLKKQGYLKETGAGLKAMMEYFYETETKISEK